MARVSSWRTASSVRPVVLTVEAPGAAATRALGSNASASPAPVQAHVVPTGRTPVVAGVRAETS